jgi:ABC-type nitrate/sulfonate/bicarbonate transport system permease component
MNGQSKLTRIFLGTRVSGVLLVFTLLLLWELSVRLGFVVSENWPAFTSILVALTTGVLGGELLALSASTLWRMGAGFALGCTAGVLVGLAMAQIPLIKLILEPTIELLRPLPAVDIIPPLIFLLGVDDAFKITIVAFAAFFPILVNTMSGVVAIEPIYLQVARTLQMPRQAVLMRVVLPASLPYVLAGMRISLTIALIVTIVAEMMEGGDGLGYYIIAMQYALRAADMYAAIIVLALLGYVLNRIFIEIEARAIHWARLAEKAHN